MMKYSGYKFCIFLVLIIWIAGCRDNRLTNRNLSLLYDNTKPFYLFQFSFFHCCNDSVELQFRVPLHEFQYKKDDTASTYKSDFSLTCSYYKDHKTNQPDDSVPFFFSDSSYYRQYYWKDYIVKLPWGKYETGLIKLEVVDRNKKQGATYTFLHDRTTRANRNYFYLEHISQGRMPLNIMNTTDTFRIHMSPLILKDTLLVYYFQPVREFPQPPFSFENIILAPYIPDSIFTVPLINSATPLLCPFKAGLYHFMADTIQKAGYTLFISEEDFPFITTHEQMVPPLRYLSTNKEFKKMEENPDSQLAVEGFWLSITSDPEIARKHIREYYTRVQYANIFFTSHKEGWMTDRGMVYIIMGTPNIVYRTSYSEIWIYGDDRNFYSTSFDFKKVLNPLSDNDFVLLRNPTYKDKWYRAVDMWRK